MMLPRETNSMECLGWRVACRKAKMNVDGERMEAPKHCLLSRIRMLQFDVSRQMLHRWCLTIVGS